VNLRITFQSKLVLAMLAILLAVQIATLGLVLTTTRASVNEELRGQLGVGANVFQQMLENRTDQLLSSVSVLASDFGFKAAAATGNTQTIVSALENHGARVGADLVTLIDLDGTELASTASTGNDLPQSSSPIPAVDAANHEQLITLAAQDGFLVANLVIDRKPYQAVLVSIDAPARIAWVLMGFSIDHALASQLQELTGLTVSFLAQEEGRDDFLVSTSENLEALNLLHPGIVKDADLVASIPSGDEEFLTSEISLQADAGAITAFLQRPMSQAMTSFNQLRRDIILLTIAATIAAMLISVTTAKGVSRPLQALSLATKRVADGDYDARLDIQSRDEFGDLATAFNNMQQGISEREQKILYDAHYDSLTGLPNRILLKDRLNTALKRACRVKQPVTVMSIGIERFKEINATLGSQVGDLVLQELANRIESLIRKSDTLGRVDGHEFLVILENAQEDSVGRVASGVIEAIEKTISLEAARVNLSGHIGMVQFPDHGENEELLMRRANIAMQGAKTNTLQTLFYQNGQDEGFRRQLAILSDIKKAVEEDEFLLNYQPKIALPSGDVAEVEALIRWIHPEHGFMPPDEFIPLAEQFGSISLITRWVLKNVVQQCALWAEDDLHFKVGINLSALDLRDTELPKTLAKMLEEAQVPANRLVMEITESAVMMDAETAMEILAQFRDMGMCIAIDDYGTGYSSLAQIKSLPVTELKIDRAFVMNLSDDNEDAVIVKSTIEMGHNMGLSITAEGVETLEGCAILENYGCDMLQGYYFSKPIPAAELSAWVKNYQRTSQFPPNFSYQEVS